MTTFSRLQGATGALLLLVASSVAAAPVTLNFTWSGASLGNNARATGFITFESTLIQNPGNNIIPVPSPAVLDLQITVTGATSGNGTFVRSDFTQVYFDTNGATLDLTRQLVGQPTPELTWGTPTDFLAMNAGAGGDFNIFGGNPAGVGDTAQGYAGRAPAAPQGGTPAPVGVNIFRLATNGGTGDNMFLTGLGPTGVATSFASNVPATNGYGLAALAALLALAGAFAARRLRAG